MNLVLKYIVLLAIACTFSSATQMEAKCKEKHKSEKQEKKSRKKAEPAPKVAEIEQKIVEEAPKAE
jgi:hypothetical protein